MGIALVGLDGRVVRANDALQRMLGYGEHALQQMVFTEFTHPDDADIDAALFAEMIEGIREDYQLDKRFLRADGRVVWARLSVSVLRAADRTPTAIIGMAEDVTERRLAGEERDRVLHDLGERVKVATALHAVAQLVQDDGASVEDLVRRIAALLPPAFHYASATGAYVRAGRAAAGVNGFDPRAPYTLSTRFTLRDGEDGEIAASLRKKDVPAGSPAWLPEEQKLLDAIAEMLKVALERRLADLALQRSEERLRTILASAAVGTWEWDLATNAVSWSAELEQLAGMAPRTFGGTMEDYRAVVHPDDAAAVRSVIELALHDRSREDRFEAEFRLRATDGSYRWCVTRGRVHRGADGAPRRITGVAHDISNLRTLQQQLEQSQKMEALGRLAGGVAHDFNNLLTAVKGYAEFVLDAMPADDGRAADVREISHAADRAAALTRQLLAFSRTQASEPKVVNVAEIVRGMEKLLRRLLGQQLAIVVRIADESSCVRIDAGQLEQVIMNLAVNARDAMPDGGRLTIELARVRFEEPVRLDGFDARAGEFACLSVTDTGTGMSDGVRARIFEPFFTTKAVGRGTGIGLATVHHIVQQGGGAIFVYSEPGSGTSLKVHLPIVTETGAARRTSGGDRSTLRGTETVLLVDDDAAVRALAERALRAAGYGVHSFADPREAREALRAGAVEPALLITDVMMPALPGPELAASARQLRPGIRVLYVSGFTDREIEPGRSPTVLLKPFAPSALLRAARVALDASTA